MSQMKRNIAKIKMAQKQLGMDDDSYRALLRRVTGKDSAAALSIMQQNQILFQSTPDLINRENAVNGANSPALRVVSIHSRFN